MTIIYGIKNCDTMKKALKWLDDNGAAYEFHDYKKQAVPKDVMSRAIKELGWENVINRRGTTWRKLPETERDNMDSGAALTAAMDNPSLIKRPLLQHNGKIYLGFNDAQYREIFGA